MHRDQEHQTASYIEDTAARFLLRESIKHERSWRFLI
ncbi:hypothetical protein BBta_p0191 (plasmid) [Bradyrhizobium sp. BTAi1]|nr:hypothetical protein BBta_p0191 [Bradyrhizobium sp. BTAi1]